MQRLKLLAVCAVALSATLLTAPYAAAQSPEDEGVVRITDQTMPSLYGPIIQSNCEMIGCAPNGGCCDANGACCPSANACDGAGACGNGTCGCGDKRCGTDRMCKCQRQDLRQDRRAARDAAAACGCQCGENCGCHPNGANCGCCRQGFCPINALCGGGLCPLGGCNNGCGPCGTCFGQLSNSARCILNWLDPFSGTCCYSGGHGFSPPTKRPYYAQPVAYLHNFPAGWNCGQGSGRMIHQPAVYMPTDTTQLGYYYQHVPHWVPRPNMIPPAMQPAQWHVYGNQGAYGTQGVICQQETQPTDADAETNGESAPTPPEINTPADLERSAVNPNLLPVIR